MAIWADFKFFGPSLPRTTMLDGAGTLWGAPVLAQFLKTFLEAPLKSTQDGSQAPVYVRRRGVQMSHLLSYCFGNSIWTREIRTRTSPSCTHCTTSFDSEVKRSLASGWRARAEFTSAMGLDFNEENTAMVQLTGKKKSYAASSSSSSTSSEDSEDDEAADIGTSDTTQDNPHGRNPLGIPQTRRRGRPFHHRPNPSRPPHRRTPNPALLLQERLRLVTSLEQLPRPTLQQQLRQTGCMFRTGTHRHGHFNTQPY